MCIPSAVEWLLFDAVGTLIAPDPPVADAYAAAARRHGSRLAAREIEARFRTAFRLHSAPGGPTSEAFERERWKRIVAATIDDVPPSRGDALFGELWAHFAQPEHWRVFEDVAPAINALSACGLKLAIASNFDSRLRSIVAGHLPLAAIEQVFVSSELGHSKPSPDFFRAIESELGVLPTQIALIGDDFKADIEGARAAGWTALYLDRQAAIESTHLQTLVRLATDH